MKTFIGNITRNGISKIAAAALSVLVLAPAAQAKDRDGKHEEVDFGIRTDNHGNVGFDLSIFSGRDRFRKPEPCERVWVEPVWRCEKERIWIDAVYVPVTERVWRPAVTKEAVTRVWVEPTFETRETVTWEHGRKVIRRERVEVCAGHYEERRSTVVVAEGRYESCEKWVLKCDGHWESKDRWVCVSDGHWEDRVIATPVRYDRGDRYGR